MDKVLWDDGDPNGIQLIIADEDGMHLREKENENKVYIYFSEALTLGKALISSSSGNEGVPLSNRSDKEK